MRGAPRVGADSPGARKAGSRNADTWKCGVGGGDVLSRKPYTVILAVPGEAESVRMEAYVHGV